MRTAARRVKLHVTVARLGCIVDELDLVIGAFAEEECAAAVSRAGEIKRETKALIGVAISKIAELKQTP
jgi:hypothetical protein